MAIEGKDEQAREPRIRLGMVGGGAGAFIGAVHRMAARLDDQFDLVAGALSSTPEKAMQSGRDLGLDPARTYGSYKEMAIREARLKNGIEAVSIVTPNHVHYDAAKEFLRNNGDVADKIEKAIRAASGQISQNLVLEASEKADDVE